MSMLNAKVFYTISFTVYQPKLDTSHIFADSGTIGYKLYEDIKRYIKYWR